MSNVPDKFKPTEELPAIDVPQQKVEMVGDIRTVVARDLGMLHVDRETLSVLEQVGLDIETLGTVKISNGFAYLNQQALLQCISKISESVRLGASAGDVAGALAKLSNALTNSVKVMKHGVAVKQIGADRPVIDIPFTPGRKVKLVTPNDPQTS